MPEAPIRGRWTIARDRFPGKPNGDRLVKPAQRAVNAWYAEHPNAWELVEVVPVPDEQAIERAARMLFADYVSEHEASWESQGAAFVDQARRVLAAALEQPER